MGCKEQANNAGIGMEVVSGAGRCGALGCDCVAQAPGISRLVVPRGNVPEPNLCED